MKNLITNSKPVIPNTIFFDEDFMPIFSNSSTNQLIKVDLEETDKQIIVQADVPNLEKNDISLKVQDNKLIMIGAKKEMKEEKNKKFYIRERVFDEFQREIPLPKQIDKTKVKANIKNGVLSIVMNKINTPEEIEITVDS